MERSPAIVKLPTVAIAPCVGARLRKPERLRFSCRATAQAIWPRGEVLWLTVDRRQPGAASRKGVDQGDGLEFQGLVAGATADFGRP